MKMKMRNDFLRRPPKPSLYALGVCATGQKQMGPPSCLDDRSWVCAGYAPTNEATTPGPKLEVWTTRTTNEAPPPRTRTHTHTHTHTHIQTDRQTDTHKQHTHTHTQRRRDTETQRHRQRIRDTYALGYAPRNCLQIMQLYAQGYAPRNCINENWLFALSYALGMRSETVCKNSTCVETQKGNQSIEGLCGRPYVFSRWWT